METGTYHGDMVDAMRRSFDRIYSIELSNELHQRAAERFAGDSIVELIAGDSSIELEKYSRSSTSQPYSGWMFIIREELRHALLLTLLCFAT